MARKTTETVAIVQSCYIPWKGYFDLINLRTNSSSYDDVQYTKRDWRNRNRIKTPTGTRVADDSGRGQGSYHQRIDETEITDRCGTAPLEVDRQPYDSAPHFVEYATLRGAVPGQERTTGPEHCQPEVPRRRSAIARDPTPFTWSTDYAGQGVKTERLVGSLSRCGRRTSLGTPGPGVPRREPFHAARIAVEYMDYSRLSRVSAALSAVRPRGDGPRPDLRTRARRATVHAELREERVACLIRSSGRWSITTRAVRSTGPTPRAWTGTRPSRKSSRLRQLLKLWEGQQAFTLNDFGCGYGALVPLLEQLDADVSYRGFDMSAAMLDHARASHARPPHVLFVDREDDLSAGRLHGGERHLQREARGDDRRVGGSTSSRPWRCSPPQRARIRVQHAHQVLGSRQVRPDLYYADPGSTSVAASDYSRNVALLHDYGLYEFTHDRAVRCLTSSCSASATSPESRASTWMRTALTGRRVHGSRALLPADEMLACRSFPSSGSGDSIHPIASRCS